MLAELKIIHAMLRENLDLVDRLARAVALGIDAIEVQGQVEVLTGIGGLRMLQVNCLTYCRFVHGHHGLEDAAMLPRVRAANPAIGLVIDRLEADHRRVSVLLDDVESAAARLAGGPMRPVRMSWTRSTRCAGTCSSTWTTRRRASARRCPG